jgi:putative spermidine/putrescine transport system permease protein
VIALSHVLVPYVVLAVWASLQKLDFTTEHAADSLGASPLTVLRRIVLPQVIPGVLSGGLIVFALAASAFATPAIIGGRRLKVVSTTIYDEFLGELNWPMGAALAGVLMLIVLVVSVMANRFIERRYKQVFA